MLKVKSWHFPINRVHHQRTSPAVAHGSPAPTRYIASCSAELRPRCFPPPPPSAAFWLREPRCGVLAPGAHREPPPPAPVCSGRITSVGAGAADPPHPQKKNLPEGADGPSPAWVQGTLWQYTWWVWQRCMGGGGKEKVLPWRRRTCGALGTPVTAHPAGPELCVRPSVTIPRPCLAVRLGTGTAEGFQRWWDR